MKFSPNKLHGSLGKKIAIASALFFIAALGSSFIAPAQIVHAQTNPNSLSSAVGSAATQAVQSAVNPLGSLSNAASIVAGAAGASTQTQQAIALLSAAIGPVLTAVAQMLFSLAGFLLGLVGMVFNWVMVLTVFQFGAYFGNSQGLLIAWGVLRDIGNIILLFGFIFMGILVILDLNGMDAKRAIPQLIIFAVLLNFSLFAAEAVVDVSNVLSAAIFNQAGQCTAVSCVNGTSTAATAANSGISGTIITTLGLNTLFALSGNNVIALGKNSTHDALFLIGAAIFMTVAMVVLLAAAIMFFIRGVILAFVLVTSPIGFAGMAVAPLRPMASLWWKTLMSEAFFAPVFLLLVLVSLKIMSGISSSAGGSSSFADAVANPSSSNVGIFLIFALMIGFLIASLMTAKGMGARVATIAQNAATRAVRRTITAPFRLAGAAAAPLVRNVSGAAATTRGGKLYDGVVGALRSQGGVVGGLAKTTDYAIGGAVSGAVSKVKSTKIGSRSYDEQKKYEAGRDEHISHATHATALKKQLNDGLRNGRAAGGNKNNLLQFGEVERAIQQMPQAELEKELATMSKDDMEIVAQLASADKAESIMKNDKLASDVKEKFMQARLVRVNDLREDHERALALGATPAGIAAQKATLNDLQTYAGNISAKDRRLMAAYATEDYDKLSKIKNEFSEDGYGAGVWKESQIDDDLKNDALIRSQKAVLEGGKRVEQLNDAYNKLLEAIRVGNAVAVAAENDRMRKLVANIKELGKAKTPAILAAAATTDLTKPQLQSIIAEKVKGNALSRAEVDTLRTNIQTRHNSRLATAATTPYDPTEYENMKKLTQKGAGNSFFNGIALP
jgi:hypothetical protein